MGKLSRDKRDIFYRKAKDSGYRARSAYKLLQIDDAFNLFGDTQYGEQQQQKVRSGLEQQDESLEKNDLSVAHVDVHGSHDNKSSSSSSMIVHRAVDLCAAPGGWSQVLVERMTAVNHKQQNVKQFNNQNNADSNDEQEETTQTSSSTTKPAIVAVDLWPIEPISGVHFIRGDITSLDTATSIINFFDGERAEVSACIIVIV